MARSLFHQYYISPLVYVEKLSIVGTMRTDRRGIPKEMKELRDREEKSTKYYHSEDNKLLLVSYVGKKKTGKKCNNAFNYAQKGLGNARQEKKT